ncbi:CPXCG motif-containing cysteine-rich protein [Aequorivita sp. SDUM287046]|uniref:CPXCG motif-containing cysteine-rich protein n=1 Tax=Aequorivita aurantiaca TaxID=3053356 RepID=A0ABT8DML2_9FLAO|nr:CPXCG motif-containing cysteine-rich protein [Aequorivita aurantiaca]MDN3725254.1 CPXCG motif-containing cysteine-rich protein [Aequorivita aurantiaca]
MFEHFFQCPHCWEEISMLLDPSVSNQKYIEDCEICCNPIELTISFHSQELVGFSVNDID